MSIGFPTAETWGGSTTCTFAVTLAMPGTLIGTVAARPVSEGYARTCARGLAMHLTNPKSIVVWLSVVSLALPAGARQADALAFVVSCAAISASIFSTYALAFSTHAARRAYRAGERWVNAVLAGVFAYAGVRMLFASQGR